MGREEELRALDLVVDVDVSGDVCVERHGAFGVDGEGGADAEL